MPNRPLELDPDQTDEHARLTLQELTFLATVLNRAWTRLDNMDMPEDIPLNARTLSYRWGGYDCKLQFDEEHLHCDWQSPVYSKNSKILLRDLKPELSVQRWMDERVRKSLVFGVYLLVAAGVVYFSDIQRHVPLLAPALLSYGVLFMLGVVRSVYPLTKTAIYSERERYITAIPHRRSQTQQRKAFEEALLLMVKRARGDFAV